MANSKPTAQTGALTLVLLVRLYRNQMIALLVKNGIVVSDNSSDKQIATLMANLLKVSKSYFQDLNNFIMNPTVAGVIASGLGETAQYFKMSGNGYMNFTTSDDDNSDPALPTPNNNTNSNTNTPAPTWWSGIKENLGGYLSDGIKLIGTLNTNNANVQIANAHAQVAQSGGTGAGTGTGTGSGSGSGSGSGKGTPDEGISTTTIVVLSLVGVAVIGTIIYFVARPKSS